MVENGKTALDRLPFLAAGRSPSEGQGFIRAVAMLFTPQKSKYPRPPAKFRPATAPLSLNIREARVARLPAH